jgi:putative SOS response-associated peptidase YedK
MVCVCGRYVSAGDLADLAVLMGANPFDRDSDTNTDADADTLERKRRFALAPTDPVPAILPAADDEGPGAGRQLALLAWGLVPPWAAPATAAQRINARVETVLDKPSFRRAIRRQRCLLPADGWYEWVRTPEGRRPHLVRPADGGLLAFAGLYERARRPDGSRLRTCSVLTGPAPAEVAWLHERAPVLVPEHRWADWLDPDVDAEALLADLLDGPARPLTVTEVSKAVNRVQNTGPELLEPVVSSVPPVPVIAAEPVPPPEQAPLW